ncbi:MAG TPA: acyltransferase [Verrucomicrobiae bacterium]|nr:acyltransferase [Verrucomicrobiae bacterium]
MRALVSQFVRYLTNSLIAHVPSHHLRRTWYVAVVGMSIGRRTSLLMGLHIQVRGRPRIDKPGIVIGNHTVINAGCHLDGRGGLVIGNNVSVSPGVWIITDEHDVNDPLFPEVLAPVRIEDHAFIGSKAMILPGVTIGRGAVVGAGAVVTRDVAPLHVVVGVPARTIGQRRSEPGYRLDYQPAFE